MSESAIVSYRKHAKREFIKKMRLAQARGISDERLKRAKETYAKANRVLSRRTYEGGGIEAASRWFKLAEREL